MSTDRHTFTSGLVHRLAGATAVLDLEGALIAANGTWQALHEDFDVPEDVLSTCLRLGRQGQSAEVRFEAGVQRECTWTCTPLLDGDRPWGLLVLANCAGRTAASWPREEKVRSLFEASQVGLNLCRMDGLWLESNQAFLDIIGYEAEEADGGLTYWDLTPSEYAEQEQEQLEQLTETHRYGPYEKEFIRKDGTRIPVRLNGFIINRDGEDYIWSLIEDISHERELEAQVAEERLKTIQAARLSTVGEMAAGFAHEINNPLSVIAGYASVLGALVEEGDPKTLAEMVDAISDSAKRIGHIVDGLRTFARQNGREFTDDVALSKLVDDALRLAGRRLKYHGIRLILDASDEVVTCPPIEVTQVIVNLVNNAFDAVNQEDDGWVRIEAHLDGDTAVISVEDSGDRPSPQVADKMFQPFFTTKGVGQGTGLGLSISRSILAALDGELYLDRSRPNTRLVAEFPARVQ